MHSITLLDKRLTGRSFPYEVSGVCLDAFENPGDSAWKLFSKGGESKKLNLYVLLSNKDGNSDLFTLR